MGGSGEGAKGVRFWMERGGSPQEDNRAMVTWLLPFPRRGPAMRSGVGEKWDLV